MEPKCALTLCSLSCAVHVCEVDYAGWYYQKGRETEEYTTESVGKETFFYFGVQFGPTAGGPTSLFLMGRMFYFFGNVNYSENFKDPVTGVWSGSVRIYVASAFYAASLGWSSRNQFQSENWRDDELIRNRVNAKKLRLVRLWFFEFSFYPVVFYVLFSHLRRILFCSFSDGRMLGRNSL
jgi:hypothetical protein